GPHPRHRDDRLAGARAGAERGARDPHRGPRSRARTSPSRDGGGADRAGPVPHDSGSALMAAARGPGELDGGLGGETARVGGVNEALLAEGALGPLKLRNRLIRAGTSETMAGADGSVTDPLVR